jgi:hypothetical protein
MQKCVCAHAHVHVMGVRYLEVLKSIISIFTKKPQLKWRQRHKVEKIQDQLVISKQGKREFSEVSMDISNI